MTAKKNPAPKATKEKVPAPQKTEALKVKSVETAEVIKAIGLYQIKSEVGALSIKAIPLPGNRVLVVLPGSSKLVEDLTIVKTGNAYSLK